MNDSDHSHEHGGHHAQPSHISHKAQGTLSLGCVVITCSDSRTKDTDTSGKFICHLLKSQGHTIVDYQILKDEPADITQLLDQTILKSTSQVIIINGGTGISKRDSTFEAVDRFLEKRLEGFGELFRYLSYKDIGSAAMLSRATAGVRGHHVIFSIPGSRGAVQLAMEQLIIPEMGHLVGELNKP